MFGEARDDKFNNNKRKGSHVSAPFKAKMLLMLLIQHPPTRAHRFVIHLPGGGQCPATSYSSSSFRRLVVVVCCFFFLFNQLVSSEDDELDFFF